MVKLGRKFFFNRTYRKKSRKNLYITLGIIGGLILAIIIFMLLNRVSIPTVKRETSYVLKDSITVELNGRMRDFYDVYLIYTKDWKNINIDNFRKAIDKTFAINKS